MNKLSIILPAYNEEENLCRVDAELMPTLNSIGLDYEIIVVDDGSTDNTIEIAEKLASRNKRIFVARHEQNMGLGAAIQTGIKKATGDLLITLDSDFTFHPKQIPALLERFKMGDADCVIGSPSLFASKEMIPFYRVFLSKSVNSIYAIILGKKLTAISPIFRLYKTQQLKELELSSYGFDINAEILFKLLKKNRSVVEIPASLTVRIHGKSKLNNAKEIRNHLRLIRKIVMWRFIG
jgi:glycosyltransferase involved in cell wall biosynthesis